MKLFTWTSRTLASYSKGHIVVMAKNIKEAKEKVKQKAVERGWNDIYVKDILFDMEGEPTTEDILFMYGSD